MVQTPAMEVPKWALQMLNNLYEIERKLSVHGDPGNVGRNVEKMKDALRNVGLFYEDPLGQPFRETRTDLEVNISGQGTENLVVKEVIKPIIRVSQDEFSRVVQKGIVVLESKDEEDAQ